MNTSASKTRKSRGSGDLTTLFMRDVVRHDLLDRESELALTRAYRRTGDPALLTRLVNANLRLVVKIANEHARHRDQWNDLVQEGALGLVVAVKRFDPERNVKLASYAAFWIRAYVLRWLLENARVVNLGRTRKGRDQFWSGTGPAADVSLDATDDETGYSLVERLAAPESERPDAVVEAAELDGRVRGRLIEFERGAGDREAALLHDRLLADDPATLVEIAGRFAVTKERMRQIEQKLMAELRTLLPAA